MCYIFRSGTARDLFLQFHSASHVLPRRNAMDNHETRMDLAKHNGHDVVRVIKRSR